MKHWSVLTLVLLLATSLSLASCLQSAAAADSTSLKGDILKLLKADVGEETILAFITRSGTTEQLGADDLVELKRAGATEAVLLAMLGGSVSAPSGVFPFDLDDRHKVGAPVSHGPMTVYPIYRTGPVSVGTYLTLDEATDRSVITVEEQGGGSVPHVIINNTGSIAIYISAGEVVFGGKQDRMIAYDVLVRPRTTVTVEVRCVERGRWRGDDKAFRSAKAMGGAKTRMAAQFKDQGAVWSEVAAQNADNQVDSSTGSYKASLTKPEVLKTYEEYAKVILPRLEGRHMVGMVVAVNGKIVSIEMFGNPGLFTKMKEKLLKAYVLDVLAVKDEGKTAPGKEDILKFYRASLAAEEEELKAYEYNRNVMRHSRDAAMNDSVDQEGLLLRRNILAH